MFYLFSQSINIILLLHLLPLSTTAIKKNPCQKLRQQLQKKYQYLIFPKLIGKNLNDRKIVLPHQLNSPFHILLIAFKRHHQKDLKSWQPFLKQRLTFPLFNFSKILILNNFIRIFLSRIVERSMKKRLKTYQERRRQILLYRGGDTLREKLKISQKKDVVLVIVDRQGHIFGKMRGRYSIKKGILLLKQLKKLKQLQRCKMKHKKIRN